MVSFVCLITPFFLFDALFSLSVAIMVTKPFHVSVCLVSCWQFAQFYSGITSTSLYYCHYGSCVITVTLFFTPDAISFIFLYSCDYISATYCVVCVFGCRVCLIVS